MGSQSAILYKPEIRRRADLIHEKGKVPRHIAEKIAAQSIKDNKLRPASIQGTYRTTPKVAAKTCRRLEHAGLIVPNKRAKNYPSSTGKAKTSYSWKPNAKKPTRKQIPCNVRLHCNEKAFSRAIYMQPWLFTDNAKELKALDRWLGSLGEEKPERASSRERSYQIWGDEKALEAKSRTPRLKPLLGRLGFKLSVLNTYSSKTESYPTYVLPGSGKTILSENLDMHHALKKILRRNGPVKILGETVNGTAYGAGAQILGNDFEDLMRIEEISAESILYVGDIDPAGIAIQQGVEDRYGIKPFVALYGAMTERHAARREARRTLDRYAENQGDLRYDRARFLALLDNATRREAERCLSESIRIPQEIITGGELDGMAEALMAGIGLGDGRAGVAGPAD